jgi:conjugal transfer pilus assembly protein TraU
MVAPIGLMMSWYEPSRFVDVTRTPFCMVGLGGIDLSDGLSGILPAPGYGDEKHGMETQSSFYQVHWFMDPIMAILGIIDTACNVGTSKSMDLMFMSEVDPTWNDDTLSVIFSPEVVLFSSLPAQLACGVDCVGSSLPNADTDNKPIMPNPYFVRNTSPTNPASSANPSKYLFWCGGCQGALYPLNGNNSDSAYAVQSSILTTEKVNGLVHRMGLEDMTTGDFGMCNNLLPDMYMNKAEWKYSMSFPIPQTVNSPACCNAMGETDSTWNSNTSFPYTGEDFTYVMYHERDCCFL